MHFARNVLDEVFGYHNHITTFAWEKKYAPQNDRNTPTDSFDYIVVYSTMDRASISTKLGLTVEETKLIDEGDPRGAIPQVTRVLVVEAKNQSSKSTCRPTGGAL